jgi:tetratricopeptide (TPR) repeat protein
MTTLWTRLALSGLLALGFASPLAAMGDPPPEDPAASQGDCKPANSAKCAEEAKKAKQKPAAACAEADKSKCKGQQSFLERYRAAVALVDAEDYPAALSAMQALDDGSSADITTWIGFIHRKLGHMAEAQMYYEAALHLVPNHRGALEYYGEWYVMMGNVERARQNLRTLASLYGTDSKEYLALSKMIDEAQAGQRS